MIGLFQERNVCQFEVITWGQGALLYLTAKAFALKSTVQSHENDRGGGGGGTDGRAT